MRRWAALLLAALALPVAAAATAQAPRLTGIIVPVFDGPDQLARNVATTLNLQVWQTLRRAPTPNPSRLDFGGGIVRYSLEPMSETSPAAIADYVRGASVQMALWGSVRAIGDGVLVQAFVAAPESASDGRENWTVRLGGGSVSLGLPRRLFDFAPIVMDRALIEKFTSPAALQMCAPRRVPCADFPVGTDWKALSRDGPWANIIAYDTGRTGWLNLADLNRLPNDISDFAAGLVSYFRADFAQAERYFGKVATRPGAATPIRNDAAVLKLVARQRLSGGMADALDTASRADPASLYTYQAAAMARLSAALARPAAERRVAIAAIRRGVDDNRELFPPDDPWLRGMDAIFRAQ